MTFVAITFLWDVFLLVYFSCGIVDLRGVVLASCLFCRMNCHWAHFPVGFFYLGCDMKVVVSNQETNTGQCMLFNVWLTLFKGDLVPELLFGN